MNWSVRFCLGFMAGVILTSCQEAPKKVVSAAAIVSLNGTVTVDSRPARTGEKLEKNATITVGADSQCLLAVVRGESSLRLRLGPGATFQLRQALDSPLNVTGTLKAGQGVFDLDKAQIGDAVKVITPTTVAAVRGTKFSVAVGQDESTEVKVAQGQVAMRPRIERLDAVDPQLAADSETLRGVLAAADQGATTVAAGQAGTITKSEAMAYNESLPIEIKELQKSPALEETDPVKAAAELENLKDRTQEGIKALPDRTREAAPAATPVQIDEKEFRLQTEGDVTAGESPQRTVPPALKPPAPQRTFVPAAVPPVAPAVLPAAAGTSPEAREIKLGNEAPREEDFQKLQEVPAASEKTVQSYGDTVELTSGKRYENVGTLISKDFVVIIGADGRRLAEVSKREVKSISRGNR
ncbi:MAG: FecR domain-containing protein [Spirochaetales bacterium]|nr:FecR domain-containing protein [Spirochaetales bacterium]